MKRYALCIALFLALPALAAITNVQSKANWTCSSLLGSVVTCAVTTNMNVTGTNLLAVWTFWESTFPYTASVADNVSPQPNTFYSAVGPTLQSASSPSTSAQIFYAKKINGTPMGINDTVTVTFTCPSTCSSPTIASAGVVVVEYSGLDTQYPLDSVSAGYSTSGNPTSLLDSGTVAPANANLLVFAGGTSDMGTANLQSGSMFTVVQKSGSSLTEQLAGGPPLRGWFFAKVGSCAFCARSL